MRAKLTILKLGGSVITNKKKPFTPNKKAITRLAKEIKQANVEFLLLIHGGGSFGHPIAKKYEIRNGYKDSSQIMGFSKTHQAMVSLNKIILDALNQKEIPAVAVQPSAFITTDNGRITCMDKEIVLKLLEFGITPVLYGDVVLDSDLGFTILSGDQLVSSLAIKLNADRIIMGLDVDGLFTKDPKIHSSARLLHPAQTLDVHLRGKRAVHQVPLPDFRSGEHSRGLPDWEGAHE